MNIFILLFVLAHLNQLIHGKLKVDTSFSATGDIFSLNEHAQRRSASEESIVENLMRPENLANVFGIEAVSSAPTYDQEKQKYTGTRNYEQDINFILYTSKNVTGVQIFANSPLVLEKAGFIKNASTKIICHGFMSDYLEGPGKYLLPAYLRTPDEQRENGSEPEPMNIIMVNWAKMAGIHKTEPPLPPSTRQWYDIFYFPPARNTEIVGNETAQLIKLLLKHGDVTLDGIHLIGHSLGAHAMGYAGKNLNLTMQDRVARITALDPAGPCFEYFSLFCLRGLFRHVNMIDATFVDVIHTHARALGMRSPVGHVDFYPNGGFHQPECHWTTFGVCSHRRAIALMAESIRTPRFTFLAHKCSSWALFIQGDCHATDFALLGEHCSTKANGVYFLSTMNITRLVF